MHAKPWYRSRTIWASLVTILTASGSLFGLEFSDVDNSVATDTIMQLVAAVSGVVALFGRLAATTKIG